MVQSMEKVTWSGLAGTMAIVEWIAKHAAEAPQLLDAWRTVVGANRPAEKWAAIKAAGDLILSWSDWPVMSGVMLTSAQHADVVAAVSPKVGINASDLIALAKWLPVVMCILRELGLVRLPADVEATPEPVSATPPADEAEPTAAG